MVRASRALLPLQARSVLRERSRVHAPEDAASPSCLNSSSDMGSRGLFKGLTLKAARVSDGAVFGEVSLLRLHRFRFDDAGLLKHVLYSSDIRAQGPPGKIRSQQTLAEIFFFSFPSSPFDRSAPLLTGIFEITQGSLR